MSEVDDVMRQAFGFEESAKKYTIGRSVVRHLLEFQPAFSEYREREAGDHAVYYGAATHRAASALHAAGGKGNRVSVPLDGEALAALATHLHDLRLREEDMNDPDSRPFRRAVKKWIGRQIDAGDLVAYRHPRLGTTAFKAPD